MKKRTIWILIVSMILTFAGLIAVQLRYVRINAEMIENQFNENVQRSLYQTVTLVEENEALEYLAQTLDGEDYTVGHNQLLNQKSKRSNWKSNIDSLANVSAGSIKNEPRPSIRLSTGHVSLL